MIKEAIKKREENFCVNYDEKLIEENRLKEVINIDCIRENIKEYERIIDNQLFVLFFDQKLVFWTEQKLSSQLKDGKLAVFI